MAREFHNVTDFFNLAYGKFPVRSRVVNHETLAVGSDLQVTYRRALGIGEWDACEKVWYIENESAHEILPANYHFHPGGAVDTVDSFFPTSPTYPGYAYSSERLPVGLSQDNKPENAIGIYRCLLIEDYDSNGVPQGKSYSTNPARVALDIILRIRPVLINYIDWGAWIEWRDWCDTQINATIDSVVTPISRFQANVFIVPPFKLSDALDKLCELSCSDWQWRGGKIRFMAPITRSSEFNFDLAQIGKDSFKYIPIDPENRPNMIRIIWRDLLHPYLKQAEPIEVRRPLLITEDDGIENAYEIDIGVANKSQAQRTAEFWAKVRCDYAQFARLKGSFMAYPVLPADLVEVTHFVPRYTDKQYKVIEKEENEEKADGYDFRVQEWPTNPYSDLGTLVADTPVLPQEPTPVNPPSEPVLTVVEQNPTLGIGIDVQEIIGDLDFDDYGFDQRVKILVQKPSFPPGEYEEIEDLRPDENNVAQFRLNSVEEGIHYFKSIAYSADNPALVMTDTPTVKSVTIAAEDFTVDGNNASSAVNRALIAANQSGQITSRDTDIIDKDDIVPSLVSQTVVEEGLTVDVRIGIQIATGASHNNADTVNGVEVDVFNQFGELIQDNLPQTITTKAAVIHLQHTRQYADPLEGQAYYRIRVHNIFGWNTGYVYLQGTTVSTVPPTAKVRANCPLMFTGAPIDSESISGGFVFSGNVDLYVKRIKHQEDWVKLNSSAITTNPFSENGFEEALLYDAQLRSTTTSTNRSNIIQIRMKQVGTGAPSRPKPTNPDGEVDATLPKSKLNFWCTSAANEETEVFVDTGSGYPGTATATITATAVGNLINYSISSLGEGVTRKVKFRHKWSAGDESEFTAEVSKTTDVTPPSASKPDNENASFLAGGSGTGDATITWDNNGGNGPWTIQRKIGSGGSWSTLISNHTSPTTSYIEEDVFQDIDAQTYYYRVKDNDIGSGESAYTNPAEVTIPGYDPFGCFDFDTLVMSGVWWRWWLIQISLKFFGKIYFDKLFQKKIGKIKECEYVIAHKNNGELKRVHVRKTFKVLKETILEVKFEGKRKSTWVSKEHPYRNVEKQFKPIGEYKEGDKILSRKNGIRIARRILKLKQHHGRFVVYNLECGGIRTYLANNDEVHNKSES